MAMPPLNLKIVFISLFLVIAPHSSLATPTSGEEFQPATYRLASISVVRHSPDGPIADVWNGHTTFTSAERQGEWLRITGYFPSGRWQAVTTPLWVNRHYVREVARRPTPPPPLPRPAGQQRYIYIDKSDFTLKVVARESEQEKTLFTTRVALGMDRCLPEEKGGRCYYTEPGDYAVRWKLFDPEGIEWCIPKSMEQEYADSLSAGERCYRGPLGQFALNIGKSYAIHGTNKPGSLGQRVSHGCVRAANPDMERVFRLVDVGDRVIIAD